MRDQQHRLVQGCPDFEHLVAQQHPCLLIQRAERLIHQHDTGLIGQCPGNSRPLLHTAGELRREMVLEPFKADQLDELASGFFPLRLIDPFDLKWKGHIVQGGPPRKRRFFLKHDTNILMGAVYFVAVDQHFTVMIVYQPTDNIEQGRLSAA